MVIFSKRLMTYLERSHVKWNVAYKFTPDSYDIKRFDTVRVKCVYDNFPADKKLFFVNSAAFHANRLIKRIGEKTK